MSIRKQLPCGSTVSRSSSKNHREKSLGRAFSRTRAHRVLDLCILVISDRLQAATHRLRVRLPRDYLGWEARHRIERALHSEPPARNTSGFCVSAANVMPGNLALALQGPENDHLGTLRRLPHATKSRAGG